MKIISNLENFDEKIFIKFAKNGEIRKILHTELKKFENEIVLLGLIAVGRRVIDEDNLELLKGRRHRKYFALKIRNKIYIKFGWHKIKNLQTYELNFLKENWNFDFFETQGMHLIEKSGGVLWPNALLYKFGLQK